jgi:hypothetical protein
MMMARAQKDARALLKTTIPAEFEVQRRFASLPAE